MLVLRVGEIDGHPAVAIAYGTSQKPERPFPGGPFAGPEEGLNDKAGRRGAGAPSGLFGKRPPGGVMQAHSLEERCLPY